MNNLNNRSLSILLKRLLISLGIILFIRMGSFLPIPGINQMDLAIYIQSNPVAKNIVSTFSGDDLFILGLLTLNIFPYINASIFVQILSSFSPSLSKLKNEGDLNARRSLNKLTRLTTLIWSFGQGLGIAFYLRKILFNWNLQLAFEIALWLTTGAMIVVWLSELITDYGLGNGPSLLIYTNIISNFSNRKIFPTYTQNLNLLSILTIIIFSIILLFGIILLQEGYKLIPLLSSKQLNQDPIITSALSNKTYIPLRLNQAGVMPIILTNSLIFGFTYIANFGIFPKFNLLVYNPLLKGLSGLFYYVSIIIFSSFYATVVLNPKDISDQLQKMAVSIPKIRPGVETNFYLRNVMNRLTILGSSLLALLATLPNLVASILNIPTLNNISTTSLLIMAGVLIEVGREVEDISYSNVYKKNYTYKKY